MNTTPKIDALKQGISTRFRQRGFVLKEWFLKPVAWWCKGGLLRGTLTPLYTAPQNAAAQGPSSERDSSAKSSASAASIVAVQKQNDKAD